MTHFNGNLKFWLISLLVFTTSINLVSAQKKLSLEQCIEIANKENLDMVLANLALSQQESNLEFAKKAIFPTLSASFSQGFNGGRSIDPFSNSFVQRAIGSNAFGINGNWNFYNSNLNKYQIELSAKNYDLAAVEILNKKRDLKIAITQAYMQALLNQELLKINQDLEKFNLEKLKQIKASASEGLLAKSSILDFEAQYASAIYEVMNSKNTIEQAKIGLAQLLGKNEYVSFDLEEISDKIKSFDPNQLQLIKNRFNSSVIFKALDLKSKNASLQTKISEASKKISMNLSGGLGSSYSSAASDELKYFNQLNFNFNQYLRLGINIPIVAGSQINSRIVASKINEKIVKSQNSLEKQKYIFEIERAFYSAKLAYEKLESAVLNQKAQSLLFQSAQGKFQEGLINSIDLFTIKNNLDKSNINLAISKYEYHFKNLILEYYQ